MSTPVQTVPAWLRERSGPPTGGSRQHAQGFVEHTLASVLSATERLAELDREATERSPLGRIDSRVKLLGAAALLVAVSLAHHPGTLVAAIAAVGIGARLGGLGLGRFAARVVACGPLVALVIALPAATSAVTPGRAVVPLVGGLSITDHGLRVAGLLVLRVVASVGIVTLVAMTTTWPRLVWGLRALRVPALLVMVTGMTIRFLSIFLDALAEMLQSRRSRAAGRVSGRSGRRLAAASIGSLFLRTHAMSGEVHDAMISRGYSAAAITARRRRWVVGDVIALAIAGALGVLLVVGERLGG